MQVSIRKVGAAITIVGCTAAGSVAAVVSANDEFAGRTTALSAPVSIVLSGNATGVSEADGVEARFRSILLSTGIPLKSTPQQGAAIIVR